MKYFSRRAAPVSRRKTSGFTLVESLIPILIGIFFVGSVGYILLDLVKGSRISAVENFFIQDARSAIAHFYRRNGTAATLRRSWLTAYGGLPEKTVWGRTWVTRNRTHSTFGIQYPTPGSDICNELKDALTTAKYDFLQTDSICKSGYLLEVTFKAP